MLTSGKLMTPDQQTWVLAGRTLSRTALRSAPTTRALRSVCDSCGKQTVMTELVTCGRPGLVRSPPSRRYLVLGSFWFETKQPRDTLETGIVTMQRGK